MELSGDTACLAQRDAREVMVDLCAPDTVSESAQPHPLENPLKQNQVARFNWQALASSMFARKAYRRFHGAYGPTRSDWTSALMGLMILLWGIYYINLGGSLDEAVGDASASDLKGVTITFVWAYKERSDRWLSLAGFLLFVVTVVLVTSFQEALRLQLAFWVTAAACVALGVIAMHQAASNAPADQELLVRTITVWAWCFASYGALLIGFGRRKLWPGMMQSGLLLFLHMEPGHFVLGAPESGPEKPSKKEKFCNLSHIWTRFPDLHRLLLQEAASKQVYSFTGRYYYGLHYFGRRFGLGHANTLQYVGTLDADGAPHGVGLSFDSSTYGELIIGHWMHGTPVSPFRAKETAATGFVAYRIGVLSARDDAPDQAGGMRPSYSEDTPLRVGVASVECCTSGKFFRGFPRIVWLQKLIAVQDTDQDEEYQRQPKAVAPADAAAGPLGEGAPLVPADGAAAVISDAQQPEARQQSTCPTELEQTEAVNKVVAPATEPSQQADKPAALAAVLDAGQVARTSATKGTQQIRIRHAEDTSAVNTEGAVGCCGQLKSAARAQRMRRQARRQRLMSMWEPRVDEALQGVTRLSPWMYVPSPTGMMTDIGAMDSAALASGRYEVLLFVHGYSCSLDACFQLLGQLISLGRFPPLLMPVIFTWPCTSGVGYPMSKPAVRSAYVGRQLVKALRRLAADGCRRVHLFGHSMGSRVIAHAVERVVALFPRLDEATQHEPAVSATPHAPHAELGPSAASDGALLGMGLGSVTFLSPDMDLGDFVGRVGPALRSVCALVTVYGDAKDEALGVSQWVNSALYWARPWTAPPGLLDNCKRLGISPGTSLGRHGDTLYTPDGQLLDVDVIVTSYLDSNIHGLRHVYFHLNREMVLDIQEVVSTGKRAAARTHRLEQDRKLVYGFLVAPSYVTAK